MNNLIIIFLFKISICEIIKIPIGIINPKNNSENLSLVSKLFFNKPYINISIGTPPQLIPLLFLKDSFSLFVYETNFNRNKSSTFSSSGEAIPYFLDIYSTGYPSKDIINFGNYHGNKFFDFVLSVFYDNPYGCIGMKIHRENKDELPSFSYKLKENKIILKNIWTVKMNNFDYKNFHENGDYISELILGDYPHEYETNKIIYNEKNYRSQDVPIHNFKFYWDIKIKNIYMNSSDSEEIIYIKNNNLRENEVSLIYENLFIVGTQEYHDLIIKNFFDENNYIKNNICTEKKIPQKSFWNYIECNNDNKDQNLFFNKTKFPSIYFESVEFNKIFELNPEDLFVLDKESNKYIFLIIFRTNYVETVWGLGIPFLKKYQFVFDEDKRLISYYNYLDNEINENNIYKDSKLNLYILIGVLSFIICLLFVLAFFLIYKLIYMQKRRKRANELDDGFDYDNKYNSINNDNNDFNEGNENNIINNFE